MWKHKESKWLVRGGRKVKCYLCGKKILAKGDLFLSHQDTGYYSHQSCLTESATISGNERRRAVKKIAVGAAVVGAIAAGAGKLIDISSQSKGSNSPDTQTILTSQGLIPPALTSDPANPVPGQMWYRSDAGVMAHFDAVQNRVVYSSEINDGNANVTSKGIVNGLSVLPNDGKGGFGPDTTKGATAPGQYGSPYTQTSGIKEGMAYGVCILLDFGYYEIYEEITPTSQMQNFVLLGKSSIPQTNNPSVVMPSASNTTIIRQHTSGLGIVDINMPVGNLDLEGFVGLFTQSTTWHGIGTNPETWLTNNPPSNMSDLPIATGWKVDQVAIFNHDANHYAFRFANLANSGYVGTITANGFGGFYSFHSYTPSSTLTYNFGNNVLAGYRLYGNIPSSSGAPTSNVNIIDYSVSYPSGGTAPFINLIYATSPATLLMPSGTLTPYLLYFDPTQSMLITDGFEIGDVGSTCKVSYNFAVTLLLEGTSLPSTITIESGHGNNVINDTPVGGITHDFSNSINFSDYVSIYNQSLGLFAGINTGNFHPTISLPANPPVSGTVYQNLLNYDIFISIPITFPITASTAMSAYFRVGTSSTAGANPIMDQFAEPATLATVNGRIWSLKAKVPAGQYFEIDVTNATIGTAVPSAV